MASPGFNRTVNMFKFNYLFRKRIDDQVEGFCFDHSINLFTCLTCGWSCPETEALEHECSEQYLQSICKTGLMSRRVLMRRKRFDKKLYAMYDEKAKGYAKAQIKKVGLVAEDHPLKTKVDLIVKENDNILFYVETEIKTALDKKFEYATLQLPHRKEKFCGLDKPTLFMLFSTNGKEHFLVWDTHVASSNLAEVANKYMHAGEFFFQIPIGNTDRSIEDALKRFRDEGLDSRAEDST